jgi:hypothetical protein
MTPAPQIAATRLDERSGVKACRQNSRSKRKLVEGNLSHNSPPRGASRQRDIHDVCQRPGGSGASELAGIEFIDEKVAGIRLRDD